MRELPRWSRGHRGAGAHDGRRFGADLEERGGGAPGVAADGVREHVLSDIRIQSSTKLNPPSATASRDGVHVCWSIRARPSGSSSARRSEIIDTWWTTAGERAPRRSRPRARRQPRRCSPPPASVPTRPAALTTDFVARSRGRGMKWTTDVGAIAPRGGAGLESALAAMPRAAAPRRRSDARRGRA